MKAWIVSGTEEWYSVAIFAETRGKAKALALHTDEFSESEYIELSVRREPRLDKYYQKGKVQLDWEIPKDRIALVKECGFQCDPDYLEDVDCPTCPANKYCDLYQDRLAEQAKEAAEDE